MSKIWNYLNSSELVYKVQNFFGLERVKDDKIVIKNKFFYYLFIIGTELGDLIYLIPAKNFLSHKLIHSYQFYRRWTLLWNFYSSMLLQSGRVHRSKICVQLVHKHVCWTGSQGILFRRASKVTSNKNAKEIFQWILATLNSCYVLTINCCNYRLLCSRKIWSQFSNLCCFNCDMDIYSFME